MPHDSSPRPKPLPDEMKIELREEKFSKNSGETISDAHKSHKTGIFILHG